ncbi:unnamed protein product [Ectocarpus sp. 13 AM-2016]
MAVILLAAISGGLVFLAVLAWTAYCYFRGGGICGGGGGGGGGSSYRKRNSRATGEGGGGGRRGGTGGHPAQSFPRAFMPISVVPSSWTTVENGGLEEDGGIENNTLAGTNPLFSLTPQDDRPQPPPPRTGGTSGGGRSDSGRGWVGGVTKAGQGGGGKSAGASGGGGGGGGTSSQSLPAGRTAAAVARAPISTMPSSDNPRPPPQRHRSSSGGRLTAAAAAAVAFIEEGNEEEQAPVWRPVSLEKATSEPGTAAPPPARRTMPERPATTCTLLASVGPHFLQGGSVQESCSSVNSGCFDHGSSSQRGGVGDGSVCASSSSVTSGTGRRRARTNSSASVRKTAATSVSPRSTASALIFSPGGAGGGRRGRRRRGGGNGGDRPRSLPPPHSIPTSRSSSGRLLRHHDQRSGVAEVGGGHPTRQRSSGGVPLPSPSPSPAAAATAAAASLAEVEALALTSIVPAVREAANSVARLMKASGGGGGGGTWVGWCGSVARTLRRAVRVLAKATAHDEQVERVLMEDIQESICEMSEIMQCYASRGLSAEAAFWSGLCHRRQSEAELAIALASQRLELVMKVRAGYSSSSSSSSLLEVSDRHSRMQRRSSQEILEDSKTRLREWRLHQVEIPATEVEVVGDEALGDGDGGSGGGGGGGGGGGRGSEDKRNSTVSTTVYLGSCMGLNAAVKAFSFKGGGGGGPNGGCGSSGSSQRGSRHKATGHEAREDKAEQEERERREGGGGGGGGTRWRETCGGAHDDRRLRCQRREAALVREVETLQRLRGPNIVTVFGVVVSGDGGGDSSGSDSEETSRQKNDAGDASSSSLQNRGRLLLAMELLPGGSLRQRLRMSAAAAMHRTGAAAAAGEGSSESTTAPAPMPLDDRALRRIVGDVCSGMAHLADLGFVHGGLSSSNVLLDAGGRAKKISDLGPLLRTPAAGNTTRLRYTAPEVLAGEDTSLQSDVFSFGMLVLECLTRRLPWQQEDEDASITAAATDEGTTTSAVEDARLSRAVMSGDRPGVPGDAPCDLARVAKDCWAHDPASRPDMVRVLEDLYPTGLTATSTVAVVVAGESGKAVPTGATTAVNDDDDDHHRHRHHRNGKASVLRGDEDDSSGPKPGPRGAGAVRGARGIGDGTTPRSFELSSPRKMFPFPSPGVGSPLATMTTPRTPSSSSSSSRRRTASLETFSTLAVSSTTSSARSSVSRHVRGASAGGGGGGGGRVLGGGGRIAGGGVLFAERSHTMPARTQRSRSRKGNGADAPSRAESLPCVP